MLVRSNLKPKVKILYVDDEINNLENFRFTCRRNYQVFVASSSERGLQLLKENPDIRVVLSDYMRSGMNGLDFLLEVRERFPQCVRIMVSASCHTDSSVYHRVLFEANVFQYIKKPWNPDVLLDVIHRAVEEQKFGMN